MKYAKLNNGVISFPPKNKGAIINYNLDEILLKKDGYKPFIEAEKQIGKSYTIIYTETENEIIETATEIIPDPEEEKRQERQRLDMLSLTKREVFLALYKVKGITPEQLKEEITDIEAQIEFEYANEYYRGNPLINQIGAMLGYSSDDLDYFFENKEFRI